MSRTYRLGTTSFIYPDALLPNVRRLASCVDDIEILFFDVSDPSGLPTRQELETIRHIKDEHGLTFSLHTPLDASLASVDARRREEGRTLVLRAMEIAAPLEPERVIVHVYRGDREGEAIPDAVDAWRDRARASFEHILGSGIDPQRLCIEWLEYDLELLEPVIDALGVSVALDVGHLHRDGVELVPVLDRWLSRSRVIHWHGTDMSGRDHRSLTCYPEVDRQVLLKRMKVEGWDGVLTLEVFREDDFESSLKMLKQA